MDIFLMVALLLLATSFTAFGGAGGIAGASGPLRVHPDNPRYFADRDGKAVYLTGSHNWSNVQEIFSDDPEAEFDYDAHIAWLTSYGHNYTRGWRWEQTGWTGFDKPGRRSNIRPQPYARTGPGAALDGLPRYDLTRFNEDYFTRLRDRVEAQGA